MHLLAPLTSITLLLTAVVPSIIATPVEQSTNDALPNHELSARADLISSNGQCTNPAQMNLANDPGLNTKSRCGWKLWTVCIGIAVGVCATPCLAGGFADPACDACCATLGAVGCGYCIQDKQIQTTLHDFYTAAQPQIAAEIQEQYCEVPKAYQNTPQIAPLPVSAAAAAAAPGSSPATS